MLGAGPYRDRIIPTFQWYVPVSHRFAKLSRSANLASLLNSRHYAVFGSRFIASMTDYYNILLISPTPLASYFRRREHDRDRVWTSGWRCGSATIPAIAANDPTIPYSVSNPTPLILSLGNLGATTKRRASHESAFSPHGHS